MISIAAVELRRMFTRRAIHAVLAACLLAALAATVGLVLSEGRPTPRAEQEWLATRRSAEESLRACMRSREQQEGSQPLLEGSVPQEYRQRWAAEWVKVPSLRECFPNVNETELSRYVYTETESTGWVRSPVGFFFWAMLAKSFRWLPYAGSALGLVLGSTIGGADWSSGWVKTLLTWESRRSRLIYGKLLAVIGGMAVIYLGLVLAIFALFSLGAAVAGSFSGFDSLILEDLLGSIWRGVAITVLGGVLGFSGAFAIRYSLAGLLSIGGYFALEAAAWGIAPGTRPFSLNAAIYVFATGFDTVALNSMPPARAALICGIAGVAASVSAAAVFSRRDVAG